MPLHPRRPLKEDVASLLPTSSADDEPPKKRKPALKLSLSTPLLALFSLLAFLSYHNNAFDFPFPGRPEPPVPGHVKEGIERCKAISRPNPHFDRYDHSRKESDRYAKGTPGVWLRNGTIWTGEKGGEEVLKGWDILLDGGVVRELRKGGKEGKDDIKGDYEEVQLDGAWVTPGIVDMHSHLGVDSAPELRGSDDTNSLKGSVQPWLRSLDGLDTHDEAYNGSIAGGITTMLVLPGSANAIGGQAFPFKPRQTTENTPQSMLVQPAFELQNGSWHRTHAWRHIKHACGENPSRVYSQTRLDTAWDFRRAYNEGKKLKERQDRWCEDPKAQSEPFPEDLQWEVLADVIRGNVKVNAHCYQTDDLTDLVRISNEFQFPIAAFHHAHEAYLVPDLLKSVYGGVPPTVAIFATNARYKKEAYRGSEFAAKVLTEAGLDVAFKSDHPVLNSRYLPFEAAQGHHYGLNYSKALSSITTIPAKSIGLDHRLGYVREGYDADIVVWDSFPLNLGATPKQTYIDGIKQILHVYNVDKPAAAQDISPAGEWDEEAKEAVVTRGDPDLRAKKRSGNVIFTNVKDWFGPELLGAANVKELGNGTVVVRDGGVACVTDEADGCAAFVPLDEGMDDFEIVDLDGGSIGPGLVSVGSWLGLKEIDQEKSTSDGVAYDPLSDSSEYTDGLLVHAVDGAAFDGKDTLLAYRSGVTTAVTSPLSSSASLFSGLSYAWSTSAYHALEPHAILSHKAALHISLTNAKTSISTKLAVLRKLLQSGSDEEDDSEIVKEVKAVKRGERRLVVEVDKADVIASLVRLKRDVAPGARITILGGAESWIIADELAKEDIGVIITPARSFPADWDSRRIIPGPPLSEQTLASYLASRGVKVGLGHPEAWEARNIRLEAAWTYVNGGFSKEEAIALVSSNLLELLGVHDGQQEAQNVGGQTGWVAWQGDWFGMSGRVKAVQSPQDGKIDLF